MNKINLLVIDDEAAEVIRQLKELKEHDEKSILGEIKFYNSFPADIETLSINEFITTENGESVDAILIDYDLNAEYTGTLLSAWLALKNRNIPRIAFTTRNYSGSIDDFDGYIIKNDIIDQPENVLLQLVDIIEKSNMEDWLTRKYIDLINQYSLLCEKKLRIKLSHEEEVTINYLMAALDSLDKQLDKQLEKVIDIKFRMADKQNDRLEFLKRNISEIDERLYKTLEMLEKCEV